MYCGRICLHSTIYHLEWGLTCPQNRSRSLEIKNSHHVTSTHYSVHWCLGYVFLAFMYCISDVCNPLILPLYRSGLGRGEQGMLWAALCGVFWCLQRALQEIQRQSSGTCKSNVTQETQWPTFIYTCMYTFLIISVLPLPPVLIFSSFPFCLRCIPTTRDHHSGRWNILSLLDGWWGNVFMKVPWETQCL